MNRRRTHIRYFADEKSLGMAKLLSRSRDDIVYPGHGLLPEIELGTPDVDWLPLVGRIGWIVLSRDRRIRTRPAELETYYRHGVRSVWIGAKRDMSAMDLANMFVRHEDRLDHIAVKLGPGPWAVAMSPSGVRPLHVKQPGT